jgi:hypothetical protein
MRIIEKKYSDPLDIIWLHAASQLGMSVVRDPEVFASWDGHGTLKIGTPETLDPDDCLAQMIFHELCHAITEGPESMEREDWGLDVADPSHAAHEHACLRLQAALADQYSLRHFFSSTTDHRSYFDAIGNDPLAGAASDPAIDMACVAWKRATQGPWAHVIQQALFQTSEIAKLVMPIADKNSLWSRG